LSEQVKIIGRGTWLDRVASEVIERETTLGRDLSMLRVESGIGASGLPHIGNLGDAIRSYGVKLALEGLGYKSELIAYSDDFDGLRKVPAGFPEWLNDYIAHPVSRIPDPIGCHASYAAHVGSLLRDSLDDLGIKYTFQSGTEAYKSGLLTPQIRKILLNAEVIGRKITEFAGQSKYEQRLPYTAVCKNCGKIYTTRVFSFDPVRDVVSYKCEGTEVGDKHIDGCGYEGEVSITAGEGKLMWKVEFAARWAALSIRFEAYGKELTDSVKINDWVAENILAYPPPHHARYELFQDKSGKKMSKSSGNLLTSEEWLTYASPESLRLLMFKRIVGARSVSVEDIPAYMDEFDELEEYYFSNARDPNVMKDAKQRGLYEYTVLTVVPPVPGVHVSYKQVAELTTVAPPGALEDFVAKRLIVNGAVKQDSPELRTRILWAARWAADLKLKAAQASSADSSDATLGAAPAMPDIDEKTDRALRKFVQALESCKTPDDVQAAAFAAIKDTGAEQGKFFTAVYRVLVGTDRGPRLGPYVIDAGPGAVAAKILEALPDVPSVGTGGQDLASRIESLEVERDILVGQVQALRVKRAELVLEKKLRELQDSVEMLRKEKEDLEFQVSSFKPKE
jgi:lysyl-tRNA synthetase class 1